MSEAQLQKILADNNRLRDEVEFTKNIAKVSVSCGAYVLLRRSPSPHCCVAKR